MAVKGNLTGPVQEKTRIAKNVLGGKELNGGKGKKKKKRRGVPKKGKSKTP